MAAPTQEVEMLFAHLKRTLRLDRLRLRGPCGARDEFHLAAAAEPSQACQADPDASPVSPEKEAPSRAYSAQALAHRRRSLTAAEALSTASADSGPTADKDGSMRRHCARSAR